MKNLVDTTKFLPGSGELAELTRRKDWSATPLGPLVEWPQSLRAIIGVILNSKFPMFLFWGKDLICFYNDAYRPSLGKEGKHPAILGVKGEEAWPETWPIIKPLIDQVLTDGEATWSEDQLIPIFRNGKMVDVYWTFSYSPAYGDHGNVNGVLVTCAETTSNVVTRKKLAESEAKFRNLILQVPVLITTFQGPSFIVETINKTALELWDKSYEQVIKKPLFEVSPELEDRLKTILNDVYTTGEPFLFNEIEVELKRTGKPDMAYFNSIYQPLRDWDNKIYGIISIGTEVTEAVNARKKSEAQIRQSGEMFKSVFENSLAAIVVTDDQGYYLSANKAASEIFGYAVNELLQMNVGDIKTTVKHGAAMRFEEYISKGEETGEFDFIAKNGANKFVQYQAIRTKVDFNLSIMMDVTEQRLAKEKIRKSVERLQGGLNVAHVILTEFDYKTGLVMLSAEAALMYGLSPDHLLVTREQIHNTFHPDCKEKLELLIERCLNPDGDGLIAIEHRVLLPDGKTRWLKVNKQVYFDEHRTKPLYSILAAQDITERKQAEEKIKESETQFRIFADSIQNLAWIANGEGSIYWYNQRWLDYTGLKLEDMEGWGWQKVHHPDHVEKIIELSKDLWQKDEPFELTFPLRRHDGEYRWFLTRAYPVKDVNGNIERWIGTDTDITEQKIFSEELEKKVNERTAESFFKTKQLEEVNQTLELKNIELEKMNEELQSFTYISSHDLQEPLRKIQTFASRIIDKEKENLSENGKELFKRMQASSERMQSLIDDLLAYSRTNTSERVFEKVNLHTIIENITQELQEEIEQKNAVIHNHKICEVNVIPFQFHQLFYNLISNSLKFSNSEHPLHITINSEHGKGRELNNKYLHSDTNYCHITVADNGIGFEPQYNERIFGLFQRLHGKNEYQGTGIGLAIVKRIIENHNGIITAKGELGKGATFDIYLPVDSK